VDSRTGEDNATEGFAMTSANRQQADMENGSPLDRSPRRMLNERQVLQLIPVSSVTLWRMEKRGQFPRGTFISPNKKIWFEDEVVRWQDEINGRGRGRRNHPSGSKS
jgi:predicted DNA-binding transcriptional regulator AlpA